MKVKIEDFGYRPVRLNYRGNELWYVEYKSRRNKTKIQIVRSRFFTPTVCVSGKFFGGCFCMGMQMIDTISNTVKMLEAGTLRFDQEVPHE